MTTAVKALGDLIAKLTPDDRAYLEATVGADRLFEPGRAEEHLYALDQHARWLTPNMERGPTALVHLYGPRCYAIPMHSHAFDNTSYVVSGELVETWRSTIESLGGGIECHPGTNWHEEWRPDTNRPSQAVRHLRTGDTVFRRADELHHLALASDVPYAITIFVCGPRIRSFAWAGVEGIPQAPSAFRRLAPIGLALPEYRGRHPQVYGAGFISSPDPAIETDERPSLAEIFGKAGA